MAEDLSFVPEFDTGSCLDQGISGMPSTKFDYILKATTGGSSYPESFSVKDFNGKVCEPYLHYNVNVARLRIDLDIERVVNITGSGQCTFPTFNGNLNGIASGNKPSAAFDIPHVKEKGKRIRHLVAEGPEPGIYIRGQLKDSNIIELPEYWNGLVDPETITVTLTQIGYSQDLIVDKIEWGQKVHIRSGSGANIHCFYEVWAARWLNPMDHDEKLQVVYEGESPADYPGGNENFLIGGWDYDRRNTQWEDKK